MTYKYSVLISLMLLFAGKLFAQYDFDIDKNRIDTITASSMEEENEVIYITMDYRHVHIPSDIDSMTIAYRIFYDKETWGGESEDFWEGATPVPTKEGEPAKRWEEKRLSKKEISRINRFIRSEQSYRYIQSALGHVDIFFYYYKDGQIINKVMISSITKDIVFLQGQWIINNNVSKKFMYYIIKLLRDKKIWRKDDGQYIEFDYD